MKNHHLKIISLFILIALNAVACSSSASTANIKNAYTARSESGDLQQTTVFASNDIFFCIVELANAPDDTITKAKWYAVDADGIEPNYFIDEAEVEGSGEVTFDLTNNEPNWPNGKYKVEVYLNGELDRTLEFSVIGGMGAAPVTDTTTTEEMTVEDEEIESEEYACEIESDFKPEWTTILCDTFEDNASGWWYEGVEDSDLALVEVAVLNGQYIIEVTGKAHSGYSSGAIQWFGLADAENFVASIDGRITSKHRGVTWGFNFWGKENNFYSFTIGKEGQYFMDMLEDNEWTRLIKVTTNKAIKWDDAVNNLTIIAEGDLLTFYANGARLDSYEIEEGFGSELSLFINVDEGASAKYYFDNALVRTND